MSDHTDEGSRSDSRKPVANNSILYRLVNTTEGDVVDSVVYGESGPPRSKSGWYRPPPDCRTAAPQSPSRTGLGEAQRLPQRYSDPKQKPLPPKLKPAPISVRSSVKPIGSSFSVNRAVSGSRTKRRYSIRRPRWARRSASTMPEAQGPPANVADGPA